jgi:hypothetical protein
VKFLNIAYNFIAVKTVPIKQMKTLPLIWKWQNDVHLTTVSSHYWSIFCTNKTQERQSFITNCQEGWNLGPPFWILTSRGNEWSGATQKPQGRNSRVCNKEAEIKWHSCGMRKVLLFAVPAYGDDSEFSPQYYKFMECECLPSSSSSHNKHFTSVAPPWQHNAIRQDSCLPAMYSWPHSITFCLFNPWKNSLWGHHGVNDTVLQNTVHQWPQRMEMVKEDSWWRCRLHSKISMLSARF